MEILLSHCRLPNQYYFELLHFDSTNPFIFKFYITRNMDSSMRRVKVKTISQNTYSLTVPKDILIKDLKQIIFENSQIPIPKQRLIFMGKLIKDTQKLSEISISYYFPQYLSVSEDDQTLHLMAMSQPQSNQQSQSFQQFQTQSPQVPQILSYTFNQSQHEEINHLTSSIANLLGNIVAQTTQSQPSFPDLMPITSLVDSSMGPQSHFPGPSLSSPQTNTNPVCRLGQYLHDASLAISRALPIFQKTADLLMMEPDILSPEDRFQTERISQLSAQLMNEIQNITKVSNDLKNIELGTQPGLARIGEQVQQSDQPQIQTDIQNIIINIDAQEDFFFQNNNGVNNFDNLSLKNLMMMIDDTDEELLDIFQEIKVADIQQSQNHEYLNNYHDSMKQKMNRQIEKLGSVDKICQEFSLMMLNFLIPQEKIKDDESEKKLDLILQQNILKMVQLIVIVKLILLQKQKETPQNSTFNELFIIQLKRMLAEAIFHITNSIGQNIQEFEIDIKQRFSELFLNNLGQLADQNIINQFWMFIYQSYNKYKDDCQHIL